ncbi:DUF2007 domain-containing protein [Chitinophaga sedimenti]|uniref:putative signal transducing protein n=1 Tax=Chitinophaga sedimenti TaxID=2033606 RepID=UPI0020047A7A|nr:DUF2007 domain-containing protein [Chitinophaga sedimenti]MCK7558529.1 DUF2007 domain-containing protein [Chitinophaga sedimenti]
MEKDWIKVFSSPQGFQAELVKGMLIENGISAVLLSKQSSAFQQMLPGMEEVYVHVSQKAAAENLIRDAGANIENNF